VGFIFAPALAYHLGAGFRASAQTKKAAGRMRFNLLRPRIRSGHFADPPRCESEMAIELSSPTIYLLPGGTARAVVDLVEQLGGTVVGLVFVVELEFLPGRQKLAWLRCQIANQISGIGERFRSWVLGLGL
jgi:adenine phosphoribosyltransferase